MTDTTGTGRIPLWLRGTVTGILVIGFIGILLGWVHLCNTVIKEEYEPYSIVDMKE